MGHNSDIMLPSFGGGLQLRLAVPSPQSWPRRRVAPQTLFLLAPSHTFPPPPPVLLFIFLLARLIKMSFFPHLERHDQTHAARCRRLEYS